MTTNTLRDQIEALADKLWRVHPKDLDAAGYTHKSYGGKYDNPRAAWYADQIEALVLDAQSPQAEPVAWLWRRGNDIEELTLLRDGAYGRRLTKVGFTADPLYLSPQEASHD